MRPTTPWPVTNSAHGFSIPAYANGGGEATNDSNVKTEETKEEKKSLTPDGNMSLVDNVKGDAAKDKEFIIVKSKGGNYFYIVIDHAAQGENTVHFLNQVDEKDLLSIIDEKSSLTEKPNSSFLKCNFYTRSRNTLTKSLT